MGGWWVVGGGRWAVGGGRWAVGSGRWAGSGQTAEWRWWWVVGCGLWVVGGRRWRWVVVVGGGAVMYAGRANRAQLAGLRRPSLSLT